MKTILTTLCLCAFVVFLTGCASTPTNPQPVPVPTNSVPIITNAPPDEVKEIYAPLTLAWNSPDDGWQWFNFYQNKTLAGTTTNKNFTCAAKFGDTFYVTKATVNGESAPSNIYTNIAQ